MASKLNPYLSFAGNAREAVEFYRDVFGGDLRLNTFGEYGAPPEGVDPDGIMHAQLETDAGFTLMVSDGGSGGAPSGDAFSISLSGDDAEDLRGYWGRLSEGGTVSMPLEQQVWGDEFGMCVDRFGIPWMVNILGEPG